MQAKVTDAKRAKVADIKEKLEKAQSFILIDYKGLTVAQDNELRRAFRDANVQYEVMKNRFVNIALNDMGYTQFGDALNGPTAIAMGFDDIAAPARIALEKSKAFKKMNVKCGMVEGTFLDEKGCIELSAMPNRTGLIAMLLGMLQAPISGLARALNAIAEKQEA